jgi:hypothetical protein
MCIGWQPQCTAASCVHDVVISCVHDVVTSRAQQGIAEQASNVQMALASVCLIQSNILRTAEQAGYAASGTYTCVHEPWALSLVPCTGPLHWSLALASP